MLEGLIAAARDKALVLIGFAGSLRRSELAALRVEHLAWHSKVMHCPLRCARIAALGAAQSGEVQGGGHFQVYCLGHNVHLGEAWASGYADARLPADGTFFRIVRAPSTLYANLLGI